MYEGLVLSTAKFYALMAALPGMAPSKRDEMAVGLGQKLEQIQERYNATFIQDITYEDAYKAIKAKPLALLAEIKRLSEPGYIDECLQERQVLVAA